MKLEDFEVLWIARYDYHPGWKMKIPHSHNYYQMIYVIDGEGEHVLGKTTYSMGPSRLYFIKPYLSHQITKVVDRDLKTYDIKFKVDDSELSVLLDLIPPVISLSSKKISSLLKEIRYEGLKKKSYYKEISSAYLIQTLLFILRFIEVGKTDKPSLELYELFSIDESNKLCNSVVDFIQHHYQEDLTLDLISESLGYNPSYICQVTKKYLGISPMRFLNTYRIHKSKELIRYSDYSLKQIAEMVGFKTIHHFTRLFNEVEGLSPGKWREKEKEGIKKNVFLNEKFTNKNYFS